MEIVSIPTARIYYILTATSKIKMQLKVDIMWLCNIRSIKQDKVYS